MNEDGPNRITLYEELKLIERNDTEVHGIWKGAHLLLFFLAFVFGSFCTFCFHMLMYLFDEKCVLFPKLLSLTSLRQNIIYEFIPEDKEKADRLPVDFVSTQWVEKSACYLPTYVPLVSGIFGLVWTTLFLMCSAGSRVLTGLQRPWRILPPVFVFSLAMGILCMYTSIVTHYGLHDLCMKLSEITGSTTCTYTVNVATLVYERRIRGVYQATRLTILSAWLHTACWLLSALLALLRVLLAIDFQLVRVRAQLTGNIDRFLEENELYIRTISPDLWGAQGFTSSASSKSSVKVHFQKEHQYTNRLSSVSDQALFDNGEILFLADTTGQFSDLALVPVEKKKLDKVDTYGSVRKEHHFIVQIVHNLVANITQTSPLESLSSSASSLEEDSSMLKLCRQFGQEKITSRTKPLNERRKTRALLDLRETKEIPGEDRVNLKSKLDVLHEGSYSSLLVLKSEKNETQKEPSPNKDDLGVPGTSKDTTKSAIKSSLKSAGTQTQKKHDRVVIESKTSVITSEVNLKSNEKETQTPKKEKQD